MQGNMQKGTYCLIVKRLNDALATLPRDKHHLDN